MDLVRRAQKRAGAPLPPNVRTPAALLALTRKKGGTFQGTPRPGDVAFFHDTHDANQDGLLNDRWTLVALVERVEPDGTVVLVGQLRQGVLRFRLNARHPSDRRDPATGRVWNHYLGAAPQGGTPRTSAQLLAGYARLQGAPAVAMAR